MALDTNLDDTGLTTTPAGAHDDLRIDGPTGDAVTVDYGDSAAENSTWGRFKSSVGYFVRNQPLGMVALIFILVIVFAAIFAGLITEHDPTWQNRRDVKVGPGTDFFFGTDHLGRDIFSRVVYGSRVSLAVAFAVVFIATFFGLLVGGISGYFGGRVDMFMQRVVDAIMSIPVLILALFIVALLGPSLRNLILALSIVYTPRFIRIARGEMLRIKESDYVAAAVALGSKPSRTILRHGVPNLMAPIIIMASLSFGNAIVAEAALSFLGLGVPPPTPSWGRMVSDAREWMRLFPWMLLFPGAAISLLVLAFNLFGDAIRDHLDPRLVR